MSDSSSAPLATQSDPPSSGGPTAHQHSHGLAHVMPLGVLFAVFIALLLLTVVTVGAIRINLGALNIWIAMAIATVKAILVALYFMHLRYDRPLNSIAFMTALVFVMIFVSFALLDTKQYQPVLIPDYQPGMPSQTVAPATTP